MKKNKSEETEKIERGKSSGNERWKEKQRDSWKAHIHLKIYEIRGKGQREEGKKAKKKKDQSREQSKRIGRAAM